MGKLPPELEQQLATKIAKANEMRRTKSRLRRREPDFQIFIYNVGPDYHVREMGGTGRFLIPACPAGKEVSEPLVIDSPFREEYDSGDNTISYKEFEGKEIADNIVNPPGGFDNNLLDQGVFIAADEAGTPSKEEILKARSMMNKRNSYLVAQADDYYRSGNAKDIDARHHKACDGLGQERPWHQNIISQVACEVCGDSIKETQIYHVACGNVRDWDKAIQAGIKTEEQRPKAVTAKK